MINKDTKLIEAILFASGLITGEALVGILLAIPIFITGNSSWWPSLNTYNLLGLISFSLLILYFYNFSKKSI